MNFRKSSTLAVTPTRATEFAGGYDLTATEIIQKDSNRVMVNTNIQLEIPVGFVGLLVPRSSISKTGWILSNSVGVIDSDYRGNVMFSFSALDRGDNSLHSDAIRINVKNNSGLGFPLKVGDRIGQIIFVSHLSVNLAEVQDLNATIRGSGGFGSTGK